MNANLRHPPPLMTQIAALAIVALVFGTGAWLYFDYEARIERVMDERDLSLLADLAADDRRIRVVGIGTSLLRKATPRGDQFSALGEEMNGAVHYARMCRPAGRAHGRSDLLSAVADARPHIVVFEKTYLFNRPRRSNAVRRYLNLCRSLVRQAISPAEIMQLPPDPETFLRRWNRDRQHRPDLGDTDMTSRGELWSEYMAFGLRPGFREFFGELEDQSTIVVVVEPPPQAGTPSPLSDAEHAELEASLRLLVEEGFVTLLRCPLRFDDEHFQDQVHLNPEGQKRFSGWLFGEVLRLRAADSKASRP